MGGQNAKFHFNDSFIEQICFVWLGQFFKKIIFKGQLIKFYFVKKQLQNKKKYIFGKVTYESAKTFDKVIFEFAIGKSLCQKSVDPSFIPPQHTLPSLPPPPSSFHLHPLNQGLPTRGPRANLGPLRLFEWPGTIFLTFSF